MAVTVRNAYKSYETKQILRDFSMTVPLGSMYGLLGASGCGKTTLLSCVVGRKHFDSGGLSVFGRAPGEEGSGIPGPKVGYMPQEIALVGEFTILDVVFYFGRLGGKKANDIRNYFDELKALLDLPPENRYVKNCSGGQQRRISFAAALIHKPKLLILDEPTVGVDPILRERIWDYLTEITANWKTTVIITTHYIEETKRANLIGLMRGGQLLAEASPQDLLNRFNAENLEHVFLILSRKQEEGTSSYATSVETIPETTGASLEMLVPTTKTKQLKKRTNPIMDQRRVEALLGKNWKQFYRNISGWLFLLLFPVLEILAFLYAVGGEIKDIPLAIINEDSFCPDLGTVVRADRLNCRFSNVSCKFLEYLNDPMLRLVYVNDLTQGTEGIKHGKYVGAMHFTRNFTTSFEQRINIGPEVEDFALDSSKIRTYLDMSNRQIGYTVKYKLIDLYNDYQKEIYKECNFSQHYGDEPIHYYEPVYGLDRKERYTEFMVPGVLITLSFFSGTLLTSQIILNDRLQGIWDRSAVAGVTAFEIIFTHFVLQMVVILVQVFEIFALTFFYYGLTTFGSLWTMYLLLVLEGVAGMSIGFLVSIFSHNHSMANITTTGIFYPMILLGGVLWPLEGQPWILQILSKTLPFTIPAQAFRNVYMKGWNIRDYRVYSGLTVELLWIAIIFGVSIYKLKKSQ